MKSTDQVIIFYFFVDYPATPIEQRVYEDDRCLVSGADSKNSIKKQKRPATSSATVSGPVGTNKEWKKKEYVKENSTGPNLAHRRGSRDKGSFSSTQTDSSQENSRARTKSRDFKNKSLNPIREEENSYPENEDLVIDVDKAVFKPKKSVSPQQSPSQTQSKFDSTTPLSPNKNIYNSQALSSAEKFNGTSKSFYPESTTSNRYEYNPFGIQNNLNPQQQPFPYSPSSQYYPQNNLVPQYNNFMSQPQPYPQMPMYYPGQFPPQMMPNPYAMNPLNPGFPIPDNTIQANYVATQPIIVNNNVMVPEKSINVESNYQNTYVKQQSPPPSTSKKVEDYTGNDIKNYIKEQEEFLQKLENDRKKLKEKLSAEKTDQYSRGYQDYSRPEERNPPKKYSPESSSKKKNRLINFDDEVEEAERRDSNSPYRDRNELQEINELKKKTEDFFEKFLNPKENKSHKSPKIKEQNYEDEDFGTKQFNRGRQYRDESTPEQDRYVRTNKSNGSSPDEELDYSISDRGERVSITNTFSNF